MTKNRLSIVVALIVAGLGAGCAGVTVEAPKDDEFLTGQEQRRQSYGKVTGEGIYLFGGPSKTSAPTSPIGVNSFLWRATLDTLSFMPLASADPFGGVIISDWFAPPESTNERFKMTVYILSRELRSDGLRVAVFRQQRDASGIWVDSEISPDTASELENTILTRARELRVASLAQ
ncbi:MAG: DUF3576 domain-containing protein [Proteobacteria bacterium]|nr:DUF3576 domain-containing protein [Pseudomonadota bacterium]